MQTKQAPTTSKTSKSSKTAVKQAAGTPRNDQWQVKAACRGPQSVIFFPPAHFERKDEKEGREGEAKAICASCSVRKPCLEYALRIREPHGIWGGMNEVERKQLLARKAAG